MHARRWVAGQLVRIATATQAVFAAFWHAAWVVLLAGSFRPNRPRAAQLVADGMLHLAGARAFDGHAIATLWLRLTALAWGVLALTALFRVGRPRLPVLTKIAISATIGALGYGACLFRLWPPSPHPPQLAQTWIGLTFAAIGALALSSGWAFAVEWLLWRLVERWLSAQPSSTRS